MLVVLEGAVVVEVVDVVDVDDGIELVDVEVVEVVVVEAVRWCGCFGGFQPGGGLLSEGTGCLDRTTRRIGSAGVGACLDAVGVPSAWTRPKPARSDHQMELTCTTVPV